MEEKIAACGLDCSGCDIFRAGSDPQLAHQIADWFKTERGTEVGPEEIRCSGCRGDRERHWSPDCWILECCLDQRGLEFCHQCGDFPCQGLREWGKESPRYGEALERLKGLKQADHN